jgi:zeaxanthin glucosyltransferase
VGEFVSVGNLTIERLSELIRHVTTDPGYRDKARYFRKMIGRAHGLDAAAASIELAFGGLQLVDTAGYSMSEIF